MANQKVKHIIAKLVGQSTESTLDVYDVDAVHTDKIANNLTTTSSGYVLDARQGKALNDSLTNSLHGVKLHRYEVAYGTPTVVHISNSFRGVLFSMTSNTNAHGLHYIFTTIAGAASESSVLSESSNVAVQITCGTNQISLAYPMQGTGSCCLLVFSGSVTD